MTGNETLEALDAHSCRSRLEKTVLGCWSLSEQLGTPEWPPTFLLGSLRRKGSQLNLAQNCNSFLVLTPE